MAQTQCFKWNDAAFSWLDANITWIEGCIIAKLQEETKYIKRLNRFKKLPEDEKRVIIGLITRIKTEQQEEETIRSNKTKNKKVKVTIKDIKVFIKEIRDIKVKISFGDEL
jgi:hypothetical protein